MKENKKSVSIVVVVRLAVADTVVEVVVIVVDMLEGNFVDVRVVEVALLVVLIVVVVVVVVVVVDEVAVVFVLLVSKEVEEVGNVVI